MKRILVVEDALDLGRLLQSALVTLEPTLQVMVVPSAEEGLLEASRRAIDLLVTDIRLPGMSGLELIKKIHVRNPQARIIVISGLGEPRVRQQVDELGAEHFFRKPIQINEFLAAVSTCLGLNVPAAAPAPAGIVEPAAAPVVGQSGATASDQLADVLSKLRRSLGAQTVFFIDDHGRVMAQAGDLPENVFEGEWASALMSALDTGSRVSRLLGAELPLSVTAYRGKSYDLALAPVSHYALGVVTHAARSGLRLALAVEEVLAAQPELLTVLERMGISTPSAAVPAPAAPISEPVLAEAPAAPQPEEPAAAAPEDEAALADLATLLQKPTLTLKREEVNAFWETASGAKLAASAAADALSYDQAAQLGLAPDDAAAEKK